jgi:Arm DNA-binding domain
MKLTCDTIRAIAPVPPKTEIIVFDDDVPGFGVRASLTGSKVFVVQYTIGNQQRRMSLGKIEMLEVDTARQKAREILTMVRMGKDPRRRP